MQENSSTIGRPRSPLFRALGAAEPPATVHIQGRAHCLETVLKHDSWAATARYRGPLGKVLCKFNRQQPILGVPMTGLGRTLAAREADFLRRLHDLPNVPRWLGPVEQSGRVLQHAVARVYVEGHPLARKEAAPAQFFDRLAALLRVMHERGIAYVDLHKRENILVGDDGEPYLFDFQVSFADRRGPGANPLLKILQEADWYHLHKHCRHHLGGPRLSAAERPWFIAGHRWIGQPLRALRRRLLVALGIRTGAGRATSEHFAEDAVRRDLPTRHAA